MDTGFGNVGPACLAGWGKLVTVPGVWDPRQGGGSQEMCFFRAAFFKVQFSDHLHQHVLGGPMKKLLLVLYLWLRDQHLLAWGWACTWYVLGGVHLVHTGRQGVHLVYIVGD